MKSQKEIEKTGDPNEFSTRKSFVSLKDLSDFFGTSRRTIRRALAKANIRALYFSGSRNGCIRYNRDDIRLFIKNNMF